MDKIKTSLLSKVCHPERSAQHVIEGTQTKQKIKGGVKK